MALWLGTTQCVAQGKAFTHMFALFHLFKPNGFAGLYPARIAGIFFCAAMVDSNESDTCVEHKASYRGVQHIIPSFKFNGLVG